MAPGRLVCGVHVCEARALFGLLFEEGGWHFRGSGRNTAIIQRDRQLDVAYLNLTGESEVVENPPTDCVRLLCHVTARRSTTGRQSS